MSNSLRKQLKKEIRQKCPTLLVKDKTFTAYIADRKWALFIFPIYIILYVSSIYITFPECISIIEIDIQKAQDLNNSSNGILASIVGITMVIIGFIFTEIKSKSFVNFNFFSERTYVFPIFYSSLANIAGMLLISMLSNTIKPTSSINNAVICGHYMIVFINIPLIVLLFTRVAKYMEYQPVFDSYKLMVLKKARIILLEEKIYEFFGSRIKKIFSDNNINTSYSSSSFHDPKDMILQNKNPKGILYDIYIKDFENYITSLRKLHLKKIFQYYPFFLITSSIKQDTPILYADKDSGITSKMIRAFKVKISTKDNSQATYKDYLENINQRYIEAVKTNNTYQAIDYLTIYKELYELYCDTNQDLR